ncbi:unnamed protein product [Allacma fusca]|uniref:Phosphatidylinositol N-acetylglucosaminyltransferase subunit C n=1 Tax=Allacma fusca TaxID=39272 RepID=A0A8J2PLI6_9HEXA|nr:unnamed protein product [Allacma fusca]
MLFFTFDISSENLFTYLFHAQNKVNRIVPNMNTFTDADIQSALRLNPNPINYGFTDVAVKASRIAIQVSTSLVFIIVYYHMNYENLHPGPVLITTLVTSACGYVIYNLSPTRNFCQQFFRLIINVPKEHMRVAVVYLVFSYLLAPTLRTLTDTISTDTIHVTAVIMLCLHLVTSDYGMKGFMVSKPISVNAAVIGSIFLASRLDTDMHSLALLTFAIQSFILFPVFSTLIRESTLAISIIIILSAAICMTVSANLFLAYAILMFIVMVLCPAFFVLSTGFKRNIYGPWDEAIPEIKSKRQ